MNISTLVNKFINDSALASKVITYLNNAITNGPLSEEKLLENPVLYISEAVNASVISKIIVSTEQANNDSTLINNPNVEIIANPIGYKINLNNTTYTYDGNRFVKSTVNIKSSSYATKIDQGKIALETIRNKDYSKNNGGG